MNNSYQISGPYESNLYEHEMWYYNGIQFLLPMRSHSTRLISEIDSAVKGVESSLSQFLSLQKLLTEYSQSIIETIALKVFPDLLQRYLNQIVMENSFENVSKVRHLIFGGHIDFFSRGEFEARVYQALITNARIETYPVEEILGYNIRLVGRSRWYVNKEFIRAGGIKTSYELIEAIEQIKSKLISIHSMADLKIQTRTIQSICSQLFPELLKQYLIKVIQRSLLEGNDIGSYRCLIQLIFNIEEVQLVSSDDKFHEIAKEVYKEFIKSENEWEIGAYHIRFKGYLGVSHRYGLWEINNKEVTLSRVVRPEDIAQYISEVKETLVKKQPFDKLVKKHTYISIQQISVSLFFTQLESYLRYFAKNLTKKNELLNREKLVKCTLGRTTNSMQWDAEFRILIDEVIVSEYQEQQMVLLEQNKHIDWREDVWRLYNVRGSSTRFTTFDFSKILQPGIKNEVKS